jgi:hypothetical protein
MTVRRLGIEGASFDGDVFSGSVSGVPVPLTGLYGSPATPDLPSLTSLNSGATRLQTTETRSTYHMEYQRRSAPNSVLLF